MLIREAGKLAGVPAILIHGRNDLGGGACTPWELASAWPGAELIIIEDSGTPAAPPWPTRRTPPPTASTTKSRIPGKRPDEARFSADPARPSAPPTRRGGASNSPRAGSPYAEGSARRRYRADRRRQARLSATTGMTRFVLAWYSAKLGMTSACAA